MPLLTPANATLDSSHTYNQGAVDTDIGKLAIGHFNNATRSGATDHMFRDKKGDILTFDRCRHFEGKMGIAFGSPRCGRFAGMAVIGLAADKKGGSS